MEPHPYIKFINRVIAEDYKMAADTKDEHEAIIKEAIDRKAIVS